MSTSLSFQSTQFDVIDHNGQPWLKASQIAEALGYKDSKSINRIYQRNADEFNNSMTVVVNLTPSKNLINETRIFSLRGCYLIAMFARTKVAKAFRVWVLDVLDSLNNTPQPLLDRLSHKDDPERKELTAMINAWVGVAPIHYAGARAIVNAHIGVKSVDDMTVTQVKRAIQFVQGKINEAGQTQQALPQQALPLNNPDALLEPHFLRIRSLIGEIRAEQEEIYTVVRQHRADVLKGNDARRSVLVNMHTTLDKLFYALDYSLDAAQVHAKGMCRMSQI